MISDQHNISAVAAVAAVRPAVLNKFFPVKADRAVAAAACLQAQGRSVYKRCHE